MERMANSLPSPRRRNPLPGRLLFRRGDQGAVMTADSCVGCFSELISASTTVRYYFDPNRAMVTAVSAESEVRALPEIDLH